jgi:hypothetical protein
VIAPSRFWPNYFKDSGPFAFSLKKNIKVFPICWTLYPEELKRNLNYEISA